MYLNNILNIAIKRVYATNHLNAALLRIEFVENFFGNM